jgi:uncharacterized protein YecA (UPF0149 family)
MFDLASEIPEFLSSDRFRFLNDAIKPNAESVLHYFSENIGNEVTAVTTSDTLKKIARLNLPVETRKAAPDLLKSFFEFLSSTGKAPQAKEWEEYVVSAEKAYSAGFRADGKVKGETFVNRASETGRNDPCPCGSGIKFKKCCMKLMS